MKNELFNEEIKSYTIKYGHPQWVDILFTDVNGIIRHKLVSVQSLESILQNLIPLPISVSMMTTQGSVSHELMETIMQGDPDQQFKYISDSLKPVPLLKDRLDKTKFNTNRCQIQVTHNKLVSEASYDPRYQLQQVMLALEDCGLVTKVALEYEFILIKDSSSKESINNSIEYMSDNSFELHRHFIDKLLLYAEHQNLNITGIVKEYGRGQFEINLNHGDPLQVCDEAMQVKRLVKTVAKEYGMTASFMAKPFQNSSGNGFHAHVSYYYKDSNKNIITKPKGQKSYYKIIAGILALIPETIALIAPNANSYRRFCHNQFAPMLCNWGDNHRGVAVRIPNSNQENTRIEYRLAGADACPYLLVATILASSCYGLNNNLSLVEKTKQDIDSKNGLSFPKRWSYALELFKSAKNISKIMDKEFLKAYYILKKEEEQSWHEQITTNELNQLITIL